MPKLKKEVLKMAYKYENNIFLLKGISDIYVYLLDTTKNSVKKIFVTEFSKLEEIKFVTE